MAVFCYTTRCGVTVEENYPCGKAPNSIKLSDGKVATRDYAAEIAGNRNRPSGCWPMWSDALGVHPDQIPEAVEFAAKRGVSVEFHPETGCVKLDSARHRRAYAEINGVFDRNGGYSDPQRK